MAKKSIQVPTQEEINAIHRNASLPGQHLKYGSFFGSLFALDLFDANIHSVEFGTDDTEASWLEKISSSSGNCNFRYEKTLEEVASGILKKETTFDLNNYNLTASAQGARASIRNVAQKLVSKKRPYIAYGSPNWVFENITKAIPGSLDLPLFAPSSDLLVEEFAYAAKEKNIAALIIVDPSNPIGYRFDREQIECLEKIASENGTTIIFDDVFRGLQPEGNRHSSSEYSHSSVIVETTSKRFSAMGIGVTWTLAPKHMNLDLSGLNIGCDGCSSNAALITDAFSSCGIDTKISKRLARGTELYLRALTTELGEDTEDKGSISLAFEGMPLFSYFLPKRNYTNFEERLKFLNSLKMVGVTPGMDWACNIRIPSRNNLLTREEIEFSTSYVRVCPTKEDYTRTYLAGQALGALLNPKK